MIRRSRVLPEILTLDPERDAARVAQLSAGIDFPWDTRRAYEIALLKTFTVPSSSRLLVATGEFLERTAKRHDDTLAIIATLGLAGYDSEGGKRALRIMNRAHRAYPIPAEEYRYTLALFMLEPLRWNERFGWRPLSDVEQLAGFHFWREVGRRMAIPDLPTDLDAMRAEADAFEARHVGYDPANRQLFDATLLEVLGRVLPRGVASQARVLGAARRALAPLLGPRAAAALGLPEASRGAMTAMEAALRMRGHALRLLPARRSRVGLPKLPTYPGGVSWRDVGPEHARERTA